MKCEQIPLPELIRGELHGESAAQVEAHIESCPRCRERARIMALFEVSEQSASVPRRPLRRAMALAATVLLTAILLVLALQHSGPDPLRNDPAASWATDHPYPFVGLRVRESPSLPSEERRRAFAAYVQGDYETAVQHFMQVAIDPEIALYLGVSLYLTDNPHAATPYLREAAGSESWRQPGQWYLANALLKNGKIGPAREQLELLVRQKGEFEGQAQRLLEQLGTLSERDP